MDRARASLQYAFNMHAYSPHPTAPAGAEPSQPPSVPPNGQPHPSLVPNDQNLRMFNPTRDISSPHFFAGTNYPSSGLRFPPAYAFTSQDVPQPTQNGNPNVLDRYAEFQMHQNHQRQQRVLAELGIPLQDKSLLDDIFGDRVGAVWPGVPASVEERVTQTSQVTQVGRH
ncbi:hypothetical protein EHS25_004867 [Saitozyma podzolica]|uniref:Uncharacterized protein n=1 Tax=Saitozyma podzolica TaxID=1890683 RepID=A0A427Y325_9TREE|nr:hypothetical protein EHS25_004867 [Saitozyma podzolica]